jgi:hypothetical protein
VPLPYVGRTPDALEHVQNAIIGDGNSITGRLLGTATLLAVSHAVVSFL